MGKSPEEIQSIYEGRRKARGDVISQMEEIRAAYNGDVIIPLPEMNEAERPAVANLVAQGLDQTAMRIASTMPNVFFPPEDPKKRSDEKRARVKRNVTLAWWHENRMKIKLRRRARHLIGYSVSPMVIRPDWQCRRPAWDIRDPLSCFPAPTLDLDEITPPDCIFAFKRSWHWVEERYYEQRGQFRNREGKLPDTDVELLEYMDDEERVLLALGRKPDFWDPPGTMQQVIELERAVNKTEMCWAVVPGRITLDRPQGQFDGMLGMYQMQARLMALSVIATERGIFPDTYLISRQGETAMFVAGPYDGRTGKVNIVKGGDIKEVATQPGYQTNPTRDYLERAQRLTAGIPAEFGGESNTNIRTGRRGDAILSAVIDFPVQEAQEILQMSLQEENKRAIAIDKAYFNKTKSFYVNWKGSDKGMITYLPKQTFVSDTNFVTYAHAGADINGLVVGIGQRVGIGLMSKRTGQELDPLIEDPELEHDRVVTEGIEAALLQSVQQGASSGSIPPADAARIMQLVKTDKLELAEAIIQVQQEAQKRQATQDAQGNPTGVAPGSPDAQPGLAAPGAGAEAGVAIQQPGTSQRNLSMLLNELRGTRQEIAVNAGAAR